MGLKRKPFQGVMNIVRFNWHFYVILALVLIFVNLLKSLLPDFIQPFIIGFSLLAILPILVSLVISYYVYDISDLYEIKWLEDVNHKKVLNVNAGFDETSLIIKAKYPDCQLSICDFYNPKKHTEVSIKRARKAYPPVKSTIQISTDKLPFSANTFDITLAILSTHEIRDEKERVEFFKELNRVTEPSGQIFVTEHLRDFANFSAYTIGFLHFHSKATWLKTFRDANLVVKQELKTTPFITTFILERNGDTF